MKKKKFYLFFIIVQNLKITEKHKEDQNNHIPTTQIQHLLLYCLLSFNNF